MSVTVECRVCGQGFVMTGDEARAVPLVVPEHRPVKVWLATGRYEVPLERGPDPCRGGGERGG